MIESGPKGFEWLGCYGLLAPDNLPKDVTATVRDAFRQVQAAQQVWNRVVAQGATLAFFGSEEFGRCLAADMVRRARAVKASGAGAKPG